MKPLDEMVKGPTPDCRCCGLGNVCPACLVRVFRLGIQFERKEQKRRAALNRAADRKAP